MAPVVSLVCISQIALAKLWLTHNIMITSNMLLIPWLNLWLRLEFSVMLQMGRYRWPCIPLLKLIDIEMKHLNLKVSLFNYKVLLYRQVTFDMYV